MYTRRSFLKTGAAAGSVLALGIPVSAATEATAASIAAITSPELKTKLTASLRNFVVQEKTNRLNIADVRAVSLAYASYTGALTERGYNKALQAMLAGNNASKLMSYLTPKTINAVLSYCSAIGKPISKDKFEFTETQVQETKAYVAQHGVAGLNTIIQSLLAEREEALSGSKFSGGVTSEYTHSQYCFALAFVALCSVMSGDVIIAGVCGVLMTVQCG